MNGPTGERVARLRALVERAILDGPAEAILLSAGLDTSIIAAVAAAHGRRPLAITVCTDAAAPDHDFATRLAKILGFEHRVVWADEVALRRAIPETVSILRSFDPMELRNSVIQYLGLRAAADGGTASCYVGDAADELFAGYSYMVAMQSEALRRYTADLATFMRFAAGPLGRALGVQTTSPFLDPELIRFAVELDPKLKIGERDGQRHGKWMLRLAFQDLLGAEFVWRPKLAVEFGSGSTRLRQVMPQLLGEDGFAELEKMASREGVTLRDAEQAWYYRIFRNLLPPPRELDPEAPKRCPQCCGPLRDRRSRYCPTCGAWPVAP